MSVLTQVGGFTFDQLLPLGAIPLGVALDLVLGDLPSRPDPGRWLARMIDAIEPRVRETIARLGGGRGGELFGGFLLTFLVVGVSASLTWLVVDTADSMGSLVTLVVQGVLIAAGLAIRSTGDRILHAAEATDTQTARRWLEAVGGRPPSRLEQLGVDRVCLAAVGEKTSSSIVAPLFWVALGGPAAMWGFLAIRSLRDAILARSASKDFAARVPVVLADLGELVPAWLTWVLMTVAAGIIGANPDQSLRIGWRAGRSHPRLGPIWGQAALAGALGVQLSAGRVFIDDRTEPHPWVGDSTQSPDVLSVIRAVRMMQISALLAASLATLLTLFW